jgi:hypothetical protein
MSNTITMDFPFNFGASMNAPVQQDTSAQLYAEWIADESYPTITLNTIDKNLLTLSQLKCYVEKFQLAQDNKAIGTFITYAGRADGSKCFFDYRDQPIGN